MTGYYLSLAARGADLFGEAGVEVADCSAEFLRRVQTTNGAFPHSFDEVHGMRAHELHAFDAGIAAVGLFDHARSTGDERSQAAAMRTLDWIESAWRSREGSFHVAWDARLGRWLDEERSSYWSGPGGCFHGKLLIPLIAGGRMEAAEKIATWLRTLQREDGSFPASDHLAASHSHASCYAIEGLLAWALFTGDPSTWIAVRRAMHFLGNQSCHAGGLPTWNPGKLSYRADAQIQFIRLARIADMKQELDEAIRCCCHRLDELRADGGGWMFERPDTTGANLLPAWPLVFAASCAHASPLDAGWLI